MKTYFKEIIDLGHEYYNDMPNLGANHCAFWPLETFEHTRKITGGKLATEGKMILMAEHCGTHIDAPRHFDEHGKTVDEVPLDQTILPGHLLDLTHRANGEAITIADLEAAEEKSGQKIGSGTPPTICWTGVDKDWQKPGFIMERPFGANRHGAVAGRSQHHHFRGPISSAWTTRTNGGGRPMRSG